MTMPGRSKHLQLPVSPLTEAESDRLTRELELRLAERRAGREQDALPTPAAESTIGVLPDDAYDATPPVARKE